MLSVLKLAVSACFHLQFTGQDGPPLLESQFVDSFAVSDVVVVAAAAVSYKE